MNDTLPTATSHESGTCPKEFICCLSGAIMDNPITSEYGHSFESDVILRRIQWNGGVCPITSRPLSPTMLFSNTFLYNQIRTWRGATGKIHDEVFNGSFSDWTESETGVDDLLEFFPHYGTIAKQGNKTTKLVDRVPSEIADEQRPKKDTKVVGGIRRLVRRIGDKLNC